MNEFRTFRKWIKSELELMEKFENFKMQNKEKMSHNIKPVKMKIFDFEK